MKAIKRLLAIAVAATLAACGSSGTYYEKAPRDVRMAIRGKTLPYHILGNGVAGSRVTQKDDQTLVTAIVAKNGSELARFVTTVVPEGTGSRVSVEVTPPEGRNKDRAQEAFQKNAFAVALLGKLAQEHVSAAIEKRPFNMAFMTGGMMPPGMSDQVNAANEAAEEMNKFRDDDRDTWSTKDPPLRDAPSWERSSY